MALPQECADQGGTQAPTSTRRSRWLCFASVNATCLDSLQKELDNGADLKRCQVLLVQEHGLRGEARLKAIDWAAMKGWDAVLSDAYIKEVSEGGGTGALCKDLHGVRPCAPLEDSFEGRLTIGTSYIDGGCTVGSWYGVTGCDVKKQLPHWGRLMRVLKCLGKPFIVGGDWQVTPQEL